MRETVTCSTAEGGHQCVGAAVNRCTVMFLALTCTERGLSRKNLFVMFL